MNEISVCICTKDRNKYLNNLLTCLDNQSYKKFNILIADGSIGKFDWQSIFPNLNISITHIRVGNLPYQRKILIEQNKSPYLYFFDDDVEINSDFIEISLPIIKKSKKNISGITPWINNYPINKNITKFNLRRFLAGVSSSKFSKINKGGIVKPFKKKPSRNTIIDHLQGPCMIFKKEILDKYYYLPWLYELYSQGFGRGEDVALSSSISRFGYKYLLIPFLECKHNVQGGNTAISSKSFNKGVTDSYGRYIVSKNTLNNWGILNSLYFFRYSVIGLLITNIFFKLDFKYIKGYFFGIRKIFFINTK